MSHIGKFVKVAGRDHEYPFPQRGQPDGNSGGSHAVRAEHRLAERQILSCSTTDEALDVGRSRMSGSGHETASEKIQFYLDHRSYEQITLGAVIFSNVHGYLGMTKDAEF